MLTMTMLVAGTLAMQAAPPAEPPAVQVQAGAHVYDILQAADEATRRLQSARYDALLEGTGALATQVAAIEGKVLFQRTSGRNPNLHIDGVRYAVQDLQAVVTAFDGVVFDDSARRIDHDRRIVVYGGGGLGSLGPGASLLPQEFNHPAPFKDEIDSGRATLEGRAFVHDVLCDVVLVRYRRGQQARWYFGAEDHLPRRVERIRQTDDEPGAMVLTIRNLEIDPAIDEAEFKLETPEGYEEKRAAPGSGIGGVSAGRDPGRE